ncbi:MAG: AAA family ATPase [Armatimonadetes bacterium]|nr:AAA family ATPase [Armatimonadota bacterium]
MDYPTLREIEAETDPLTRATMREQRYALLDHILHPIYEHEPREIDWLVKGLIPKGYLCILAGEPKVGKTCLATALALAVATGTSFAGAPTEQCPVIWLSLEEGPDERRLFLRQSPLAQPSTPLYTCYEPIAVDNEEGLDILEDWITKTDAGLVVVDPLHAATSGRSLADGWAARKTLKHLKRLCSARQVTALVLHHVRRPTHLHPRPTVAESAQLRATASMEVVMTSRNDSRGLRLSPTAKDDHPAPRFVTLFLKGRGTFANRTISLVSTGPLDFQMASEPDIEAEVEPITIGYLERMLLTIIERNPATANEMAAATNHHPNSVRNALARLRTKGLVTAIRKTEDGSRIYSLADRSSKNIA